MINYFLIFPNTLFDIKYLDKTYKYIIYEHPDFFTKYIFNKKKLILHRASMVYYYDLLKDNDFNVQYIEFNKKLPKNKYSYFDPINKIKINGSMIESPNFLLSKKQYNIYRNKTDKFKFNNFYLWAKKELNLYTELKSLDKFNRKKYNFDIPIVKVPKLNNIDEHYINMAVKYINKHFKNNYGNCDNVMFPISHTTAKKWLNSFLKNKLSSFGDYQDFINKDNNFMFHSLLSCLINIGLINPDYIITKLNKYYKLVELNNFEGFLRQLFWREYQRYCYIYVDFNCNYFNNNKKLTKNWYNGTLDIKPVDDLIISGFNTGYIHHIGRLMVIGNFMMLNNISPKEGFKWFMEFSCDSYEWVMYQNVYDMVFFTTGGLTTRKPYITSSNYILKMSNYKKDNWCDTWDELYYNFLKKNKDKLYKFRYYFPLIKKL
jgi:deoxyribodipyrimidine photolyase-related protein